MGNNTISQKIDAYAQANLKALKQEEAKTGRKMTKFDIAQYMLQHGKLNKNEYANWMNTTEGFNAQAMTQQQKTALKQGSVWGFAGYGGGQESYLDSMTSFSQKTPVEKQNAISGHQMKLNETVAERKKKTAEIQKHIQEQRVKKQILHPNEALKEQKFKDHISSLPEVDATYTELMNDIKFQNMDKKQKTEFLLKTTGQKFYEAKERGDKEAMKEYLKQGIGLTFAYMDDKAGITDVKEVVKKYSGLNAVVDAIDKFVDDGDNSNLSLGEKTWETIKGAGDAVDGFIGSQGAAFVGALAVAGEAAAAAGIGKAFALVTQAYFAYEGGTMVVDGAVDVANAQTKEEARVGGQELGTGAIMLGGAAKSVKQGYRNIKIKQSDAHAQEFVKTANDQALVNEYNARENYGVTVSLDIYKNELIKRGYKPNENGYFETPKPTRPSTYRDELPTPDYSKTRENFPADAHQSLSKPGKATAYTTDGKPDGIVYQGKDGKMYVPNKWDPEHPYEVSTGADGKPASVIMIYDEAGGDFAVGDPTTIASTYKNPATGKLDPLYHAETGKANAMEIVKDQVPSAYKIVKPGTEIQTKEGPRVVQDGEIVVYDTDGDPYVMPKKNFLKRQEPLKGDAESEALYAKLKNGEAIPETEIASSGNATKPSAKTFTLKAAAEAQQKSTTNVETVPKAKKTYVKPETANLANLAERLRSGEAEMQFDTSDPVQKDLQKMLNDIKYMDKQAKSVNDGSASIIKFSADYLANEFEAKLTEFVKDKQTNNTQTAKEAYVKPETTNKGVTVEDDVMSSAFEKPVWKNTVISKTARADVKYVKEQYGLDIDILQGNKVKIGNEVFDCGNLDKGEVAKIVKNVNDKSSFIEIDLKSKTYNDELKFFETYSDAYNKQAVRKSIVEDLPSELQAEGREWLLANESGVGKTKSNGNKISRKYVNSYVWDNTNLKFSRDGKYATNTEMTLKLDLLAKHGYEVTVDGLDYGNSTHLTGVKVTRDGVTKTIDYDSNFSTQESFNKWLSDALQDIVNESK